MEVDSANVRPSTRTLVLAQWHNPQLTEGIPHACTPRWLAQVHSRVKRQRIMLLPNLGTQAQADNVAIQSGASTPAVAHESGH